MLPAAGERIMRLLRHLVTTRWQVRRAFGAADRQAIEDAIQAGEQRHAGELRVAIEAALPFADVLGGLTPRERALQVFRELDVWDTQLDNGVLVYVLYAEHAIEIVADRGYRGKVEPAQWDALCVAAAEACRDGRPGAAVTDLVTQLGALIAVHFPTTDAADPNELPDTPLFL